MGVRFSRAFMDKVKGYLPSKEHIVDEAIEFILKKSNVSDLKTLVEKVGFSEVIIKLENIAHEIYLNHEKEAFKKAMQEMNIDMDKFLDIMLEFGCKSISNIRRGRAGSTVELLFNRVLKEIEIPSEVVTGKSKREEYIRLKKWFDGYIPDIVIPSIKKFLENPNKAVAVAIKRTCRERWREDRFIFKAPNGVFIALYPEEKDWKEFNIELLKNMKNEGFRTIFVNDRLYEERKDILDKVGIEVKKLSDFPEYIKSKIQ